MHFSSIDRFRSGAATRQNPKDSYVTRHSFAWAASAHEIHIIMHNLNTDRGILKLSRGLNPEDSYVIDTASHGRIST